FYWSGFKQETTHTWFCMFNIDGLESPLIGLMHQMWTGKKLNNAAPIVDSLNIGKMVRYQNIYLKPDSEQTAKVTAADSDKDPLTYK
ncbi:MAG: hypothetical protein Q8S54_05240, partial [Bacteroidota bacterium]|nr:hypothetical protein [Bacteroidota bacterium]